MRRTRCRTGNIRKNPERSTRRARYKVLHLGRCYPGCDCDIRRSQNAEQQRQKEAIDPKIKLSRLRIELLELDRKRVKLSAEIAELEKDQDTPSRG